MLYLVIKWLHVLFAITAVGANITYGFWLNSLPRDQDKLVFSLKTIKRLDDRLANPAFALILITGFIMLFVGRLSIVTPWHLLALILFVAFALLGIFGYRSVLHRQIKAAETGGAESAEYARVERQGAMVGMSLGIIVLVIVFLMVIKPSLWA